MRADKRRARFGAAYSRTVTLTIDFTPLIRGLERMIDAILLPSSAGRTGYQHTPFPPSIAPSGATAYFVPFGALANPDAPTLAELQAVAQPLSVSEPPVFTYVDEPDPWELFRAAVLAGPIPIVAADGTVIGHTEPPVDDGDWDREISDPWSAQRVTAADYDDPETILGRIDQVLTETGDQR